MCIKIVVNLMVCIIKITFLLQETRSPYFPVICTLFAITAIFIALLSHCQILMYQTRLELDRVNEMMMTEKELQMRKDMQQSSNSLSKQITDLNLIYTHCDFERSTYAECKEEKKKLLKLINQLILDKAALDKEYAEFKINREDFEQCKVKRRELEPINRNLEADLRAITLGITHSYDDKELKTCERPLHTCKVNMLDYLGQYEACLKDKGSTNTELQKNDVKCKVELAKCVANLRQAIDISSQCQEKLDKCWC